MEKLVGKVINNFEVQEVIGRGGMGIVYRAFHPALETHAAIKVLRPELAQQPGFYERFLQEARTAVRLDHPNIVDVLNFGKYEDLYYLMMEFIDGPSLREIIRENPKGLPLPDIIEMFRQIADVLYFSHEMGVLHRDLKPDNILLTRSPRRVRPFRAIVTDFGLVKLAEHSLLQTQAGISVGTPAYMSPEQCRGEDLDPRADIYSLGIMLFESLTGQRPYPIRTLFDAARYHSSGEPVSVRALNMSLPVQIDNLVKRMVAVDPKHRPANGREVMESLERIAAEALSDTPATPSLIQARVMGEDVADEPEPPTPSQQGPYTMPERPGETTYRVRVLLDGKPMPIGPFAVGEKALVVGRQAGSEIMLDHPQRYVSKQHCEIVLSGGRVLVRDLRSTNGTYIDSALLQADRFYAWMPNQSIRLGPYSLELIVEQAAPPPPPPPPPPPEQEPVLKDEDGLLPKNKETTFIRSAAIHLICAEATPKRLALTRSTPVVIGRVVGSDMLLPNARVSKRHCQVERKGLAVLVTDLGSTNGSFLDGERLAPHTPTAMGPNSELRIGPYVFTLDK